MLALLCTFHNHLILDSHHRCCPVLPILPRSYSASSRSCRRAYRRSLTYPTGASSLTKRGIHHTKSYLSRATTVFESSQTCAASHSPWDNTNSMTSLVFTRRIGLRCCGPNLLLREHEDFFLVGVIPAASDCQVLLTFDS